MRSRKRAAPPPRPARASEPVQQSISPQTDELEIFLVATPGLEDALCAEARAKDFEQAAVVPGGVTVKGRWPEVWRANLEIRGATRVLARIGSFRAMHLAQLDKRARKFPWREFLRADVPVKVEATCRASRIYHSGAAAQRIKTAIREELGAPISAEAALVVKVRIEDDLCTISIDTSGESLHKRGHKQEIGKAPMRETMASLFLGACGFDGKEPVLDPMCGSGTFVIEAAEIAMGLKPGRSREFPFQFLKGFDEKAWRAMRDSGTAVVPASRYYGSDHDAGAIRMSKSNAERAGVSEYIDFQQLDVREIAPPEGRPGLVIVNPPYGARIGDRKPLTDLHAALGDVFISRFSGWRIGLITADAALAKATGLPFAPPSAPIAHGGLSVRLFQTGRLK
ncbi:MAG: class I SAM-dependent RNA methyltransferase [Rhizobiales bacterium]|nr:class I SAM-dependent RNA methyltransferase [Hyphomicrobiales bacterium]